MLVTSCHILPAPSAPGSGEPSSASRVERALDRDEVRERPHPVDLDHGQVLAVRGLQRLVAADVDELEVNSAGLEPRDDLDRALAEVAALRVVDA